MNKKLDNFTGTLFKTIVSLFLLWIVFKIAVAGYNHVEDYFSGEQLKQETFKKYSNDLYHRLDSKDLSKDDIIKITNHYNRKSDNSFKEIGYAIILEDFYVKHLNDANKSSIFIQNLEDINKLISSYSKQR